MYSPFLEKNGTNAAFYTHRSFRACDLTCWKSVKNVINVLYTGCLKKCAPFLTGNRNEAIRYHYSPSGQLNLSIFNLDPHTLHLKIGHQTLEIQACKVKIYSATETRGSVKGPSHDLLSQACCTGISTLTFSFLH